MFATLKSAGRAVADAINRFDDLSGKQKLFWLAVAFLVWLAWPFPSTRHHPSLRLCEIEHFDPALGCEIWKDDEPQFGRY